MNANAFPFNMQGLGFSITYWTSGRLIQNFVGGRGH
jgi:hypothetical protein